MSPKMTETLPSGEPWRVLAASAVFVLILHLSSSAAVPAHVGTCFIHSADNTSQASLTCYLPEDISQTKSNLNVYYNTSHGDEHTAISCGWIKDSMQCMTARGYVFDGGVTDHLTLRITRLEDMSNGTCSCQLTGAEPVDDKKAPVTSSCLLLRGLETEPTSLTCTFSVDVNATRTNFTVVHVRTGHRSGTEIVSCLWVSNDLSCSTHPGYELSSAVTHHVVIRVTRAPRDQTGSYACHVLGSQTDGFESCAFILMTDGHYSLHYCHPHFRRNRFQRKRTPSDLHTTAAGWQQNMTHMSGCLRQILTSDHLLLFSQRYIFCPVCPRPKNSSMIEECFIAQGWRSRISRLTNQACLSNKK